MKNKNLSENNLNVLNKYLDTFVPKRKNYYSNVRFTSKVPKKKYILHIGVGGFHRSHQGFAIHEINKIESDVEWKYIGVGLLEFDKPLLKTLKNQDYRYTLVSRSNQKSMVEIMKIFEKCYYIPEEKEPFFETIFHPEIHIISLTITEKGYHFDSDTNLDKTNPDIDYDIVHWTLFGNSKPKTAIGFICTYLKNIHVFNYQPITIMSCDNLCHNGDLLKKLCIQFLEIVDPLLIPFLQENIAFPNSMVDRITPYTTKTDRFALQVNYNIIDEIPVVCENFFSWALENKFSSEIPMFSAFHRITLTDNVTPYENQKLVFLNSSHSFIGYLGYRFNIAFIFEFMMDSSLVHSLTKYMETLLPCFENSTELDHSAYIIRLKHRFENFFIKDEIKRILQDGSRKLNVSLQYPLRYFFTHQKSDPPSSITFLFALFLYFYLSEPYDNIVDAKKQMIGDPIRQELSPSSVQESLQHVISSDFHDWNELFTSTHTHLEKIKSASFSKNET